MKYTSGTKTRALQYRPGDGSVRARRVAILVADGVDGEALKAIAAELTAAEAVPRFVGSRLGIATSSSGDPIEVDVTMEAAPSVLWDGLILPGGGEAVQGLASDGRTLEFLKDQYRHCKTILAIGEASQLLDKAGVPHDLPSGAPDPGLLLETASASAGAFISALARHRHFDRETDPPRV